MTDDLSVILERIASGENSEADITALQQALQGEEGRSQFQLGKYNITIGEGKDIQIGDHIYAEINDAAVQAIVAAIQGSAAPKSPAQIDFQPYLQSLVDTYKEWWRYYTLTDATGKIQESKSESPSPFDFGLMVQTVAKEKDSVAPEANLPQEKQEKTERLPVLEGICKYADDHVLLVGRPGSGKSTALIRLLLEMATQALEQGSGQIPILVELRYWQTSVIDRIQAFLHKHNPMLSLDDVTLSSLLRQGHFLLLVDGLNELPSEMARTQLSSFRQDYSKVPMIFTTRHLGLGGDLGIEKKLEMQPLTVGQMQEFIRAYVPDQAEAMLRQLSVGRASGTQSHLREFGQTPLLLWMLCEVFQQSPEHQMPSNLAGVFQAFTRMYEDSSVRKHEVALLKGDVRPLSDRRLWKPALQAIAAVMMQGDTPVDFRVAIHQDEAEQELSRIFPNEQFPVRDILNDLLKYHLLQNRSADQIEFRHQLIQEYYAAEHLLRLLPELSDEQLKRDYLNLLKWTEPIALLLTLVDKEEQALWVVRLAINEVDMMLGAKLAGEVKDKFQKKATSLVTKLNFPLPFVLKLLSIVKSETALHIIRKSIEDQEPETRKHVISALSKFQNDAASRELLTLLESSLKNKNSDVDLLIKAFHKIGTETAVSALIEICDSESHHQTSAMSALAELGNKAAMQKLIFVLKGRNKDYNSRQYAAACLGNIQSQTAVLALLESLKDRDLLVREKAAQALGKIGDEAVIPQLLETVRKNSDCWILRYAIRSIWQISLKSGRQKTKSIFFQFLDMLEERSSGVRAKGARALGGISNFPELLSFIDINAIEMAGSKLTPMLQDKSPKIREEATYALGHLGIKKAIPLISELLIDKSYDVRKMARPALTELDKDMAILAFSELRKSCDSEIRYEAVDALIETRDETAIRHLLKFLKDEDFDICNHALSGIGELSLSSRDFFESSQFNCKIVVLGLITAAKHPSTRVEAVIAMGRVANRLKLLSDSIQSILQEKIIPWLKLMFRCSDSAVRQETALALGRLGEETSAFQLIELLENRDYEVRLSAALALCSIDRELGLDGLLKAIEVFSFRNFHYNGDFFEEDNELEDKLFAALNSFSEEAVNSKILGILRNSAPDSYSTYKNISYVLEKIGRPTSLISLYEELVRTGEDSIALAISQIQARCKFYNYEITRDVSP